MRDEFDFNTRNLLGAGTIVQNQNQKLLDVVRGEIDARRNFPYDQLTRFGSRFSPFDGGASAQYGYEPSNATKLGGAALIAGSAYNPTSGSFDFSSIFGR